MDIPRLLEQLSVNHEMCDNCGEMFYLDPDAPKYDNCAECVSRTEFLISVGTTFARLVYKYHMQGGVLENMSTSVVISAKIRTLRRAIKALESVYHGEVVQVMR